MCFKKQQCVGAFCCKNALKW